VRSLVRPVIAWADPAVFHARVGGRSYWIAKYRDGHEVREYDGVDWPELPTHHGGSPIVEARLVCPDGSVGVLGNSKDATGRLFQFKIGQADVGTGGAPTVRRTTAHVLGYLTDLPQSSGTPCHCFAWEWPGRFVEFEDTYPNMRYGGPVTATLSEDATVARVG
jgi:hypothetical protein